MIVDLNNPDIVYCGRAGEYYLYSIPIDNFEGYNITEQNKIKTVLIPCKNFSGLKCKNCGARHKIWVLEQQVWLASILTEIL